MRCQHVRLLSSEHRKCQLQFIFLLRLRVLLLLTSQLQLLSLIPSLVDVTDHGYFTITYYTISSTFIATIGISIISTIAIAIALTITASPTGYDRPYQTFPQRRTGG